MDGGGRRRGPTAEDHALDQIAKEAESRLAAKRQARAEAREIRMREIERQQREQEESRSAGQVYEIGTTNGLRSCGRQNSSGRLSASNSYHSSRRSSEDSLEETSSLGHIRSELREAEDKFRKAMIGNAQLDNEKAAAAYQVDLYKDRLEELGEEYAQLQREHREKCRQYEQMKRDSEKLAKDLALAVAALEERDRLIQEEGLVIVGGDGSSSSETDDEGEDKPRKRRGEKRALVSTENANLLATVSGSLDVRLKKLAAERNELSDELRHVKLELEEERNRGRGIGAAPSDLEDIQREANKQLGDYKFKLQKAEQDVSTLQATVARLEGQVSRYKTAAETAEKVEDELKLERRKLQRELRECQARIEELETSNTHLQRRLDKLKTAKSALLKDL